jgi:chromosome segregation ATPase
VHAGVMAAQQEETVLAAQEKRLTGMLAATREVAREAEGRLTQVQGLAVELRRSAAVKDELLQELARVQAQQRDVAAQVAASGDQLARLETAARGLDKGRSELAFTEKRIAAFQARASELEQMTGELDAKIAGIAHRGEVVEAVRNELAAVHEVSARSRAVLDDVMESVSQLTGKVQEAQAALRSLQGEQT